MTVLLICTCSLPGLGLCCLFSFMLVLGPVFLVLDRVSCCQEHGVTLERVFLSCALVLMFFALSGRGDRVFAMFACLYAHVSMSRVGKF